MCPLEREVQRRQEQATAPSTAQLERPTIREEDEISEATMIRTIRSCRRARTRGGCRRSSPSAEVQPKTVRPAGSRIDGESDSEVTEPYKGGDDGRPPAAMENHGP